MAFDFGYFARMLEKAGDTLASRFQSEYQRKRDLQYSMDEFKQKAAIQHSYDKETQAQRFTDELRLQRARQETDLEHSKQSYEFQKRMGSYFDNPDLMNIMMQYEESEDPIVREKLPAVKDIIGKLRMGQTIGEPGLNQLKEFLPDNAFSAIANQVTENEDRERQWKYQQSVMRYQADQIAVMRMQAGRTQLDDILALRRNMNDVSQDRLKIESDPQYQHIKSIIAAGGTPTPFQQQQLLVWENHLRVLDADQAMLVGIARSVFGGEGKGKEIEEPKPKKITATDKANIFRAKPTTAKSVQSKDVRSSYGIEPNVQVFRAQKVSELPKIRRAKNVKEGALVYFEDIDEMWELVKNEKGSLGLGRQIERTKQKKPTYPGVLW